MVNFLNSLNNFLWGLPLLIVVIMIALYFTARSGFFTVSHFGYILKNTLGSLTSKEANTKKEGQVSPFEAVCVAIGGCVGGANISGVATAIATGGPGAIFWMWVYAFFGMMLKLAEIALGCYYRSQDEKGNYYGGAQYYIEKGIGREMGKTKFAAAFSVLFCLAFIFQAIQGSQGYNIAETLNMAFGWNMIVVTLVYSLFVVWVIWNGTPHISMVASRAVPFMCIIYLLGGIAIIIFNINQVPAAIVSIFKDAFTGHAAVGGFIGSSVAQAIRQGVNRSVNSNEAGMGSSPLVHGSADTVHPIRQGMWGSFEVFIDTLVVCSITALAVVTSGAWTSGSKGVTLTIEAFSTVFGPFAQYYIAILIILFGFTTTAGYFVYYQNLIAYLLRKNPKVRDRVITFFKLWFPLWNVPIVAFITLTNNDAELFWTIVSIVTIFPTIINLIALVLLHNKFFTIFRDYKARYFGEGTPELKYVFYEDDPAVFAEEEAIRKEVRRIAAEHK